MCVNPADGCTPTPTHKQIVYAPFRQSQPLNTVATVNVSHDSIDTYEHDTPSAGCRYNIMYKDPVRSDAIVLGVSSVND